MIYERTDCQAQQMIIDNGTITPEDQKVPIRLVDGIQTTIKEKEHFWHYRDKFLSDLRPKQMKECTLSNCITTLINIAKFTCPETKETLKNVLLQHAA